MKTYKHLYDQVVSFDNLYLAARKARRNKRSREDVAAFEFSIENELLILQRELADKTYRPGPYKTFLVHEKKDRWISAAPYRDRVVHHALMNVIGPLLERSFIDDSYANRVGKGTHSAIKRFQEFARRYRYVLKCDIKKYFPSIDRDILYAHLSRKIVCADTLWLIGSILDNTGKPEPVCDLFPGDNLLTPLTRKRGIPIGNLTSQFFADFYLEGFDHFVKEKLRIKGYVRYVDDFALFGDDRAGLRAILPLLEQYLTGLRLKLHPDKCLVYPVGYGANFLGFKVFPSKRLLLHENVRHFVRRTRRRIADLRRGRITPEKARLSLAGWIGHAINGRTVHLREKLYQRSIQWGMGDTEALAGRGAWRLVEQQCNRTALRRPQQEQAQQQEQQQRLPLCPILSPAGIVQEGSWQACAP
jgi:retron-type reverse transcriptase